MFPCLVCDKRYTPKDVEQGDYFISTGVCRDCYVKMAKSKATCFGKKEKFDLKSIACSDACEDAKICRSFVFHIKEWQH